MPGMFMLADLVCPLCTRRFFGDLPASVGLYYPSLIEQESGEVHAVGPTWFSQLQSLAYNNFRRQPPAQPPAFKEKLYRTLRKPVILNCLDCYYGHSLLKLLNAQYYLDHHPDFDLVLLIQPFLRWHESVDQEIKRRLVDCQRAELSIALPVPSPRDYDVARFSRVSPRWRQGESSESRVKASAPQIAFIWRDERLWAGAAMGDRTRFHRLGTRIWRRLVSQRHEQQRRVVALASALRKDLPQLQFCVAGYGRPGGLPSWIEEQRHLRPDEAVERAWCRLYASCDVVVGVHGSNMLLPSAHAGAVVEFVPVDRWGNLGQDILVDVPFDIEAQDALVRYRFLPLETSPCRARQTILHLLETVPFAALQFRRPWNDHQWLAQHKDELQGRYEPLLTGNEK
jgi:hypothetical protein